MIRNGEHADNLNGNVGNEDSNVLGTAPVIVAHPPTSPLTPNAPNDQNHLTAWFFTVVWVGTPLERFARFAVPIAGIVPAIPNTMESFFLPNGHKDSYHNISVKNISLGVMFSAIAFLINITFNIRFIYAAIDHFRKFFNIKLKENEVPYTWLHRLILFLALLPAGFAAGLMIYVTKNSLVGAPAILVDIVMGFSVANTFFSRWFGLLQFPLALVKRYSNWQLSRHHPGINRLFEFQHDLAIYPHIIRDMPIDAAIKNKLPQGPNLTIAELQITADVFYKTLEAQKVSPYGFDWLRTSIIVPGLQTACVFYTMGLLPIFTQMVHKGLSEWWKLLDGITFSMIGGAVHMFFYLSMAWSFIPTCMKFMDVLYEGQYSRAVIFAVMAVFLLIAALSGAGLMTLALNQIFDYVVNDTLLRPGQPYSGYWHTLIEPLKGIVAAAGAGLFCNGGATLQWWLHKNKKQTQAGLVSDSITEVTHKEAANRQKFPNHDAQSAHYGAINESNLSHDRPTLSMMTANNLARATKAEINEFGIVANDINTKREAWRNHTKSSCCSLFKRRRSGEDAIPLIRDYSERARAF